jgi:hypothetical protein
MKTNLDAVKLNLVDLQWNQGIFDLLNDNIVYLHKYLWKMKVLLKTKIFMWFIQWKEILLRIISWKEIGKALKSVVPVITMRLYKISSSVVLLQK